MIKDKGILSHYKESKRIITEARHDGRLVLFVGAGASICSGMLAWPQAIEEIASYLGTHINTKKRKLFYSWLLLEEKCYVPGYIHMLENHVRKPY